MSCDDQILSPVALGDESDDGTKPLRMRVALPKPCIGHCEIAARYSLPAAGTAGELHVPLVMPLDAELAGNNLSVVSAAEQQVDAAGGDWTVIDSGVAEVTSPRTRGFSAVRPTNEVILKLHGESGDAPVIVERAWLQTCLPSDPRAAPRPPGKIRSFFNLRLGSGNWKSACLPARRASRRRSNSSPSIKAERATNRAANCRSCRA